MKKILIVLSMLGLSQFMTAQCCDVISSNGMNAVTKNGICVTTTKGAEGDCGTAEVDTDGDGIVDSKDACPTVPGKVNGCPDKDADGVADGDDVCPNLPGILANKGCPEVSNEEKEILYAAIHGVKFESAKDIITPESYTILDNVVRVLNHKPQYKLAIKGHTDSQGDDTFNLDLSKKRAAAVKKYLEDKGITASRLTSEGYGETIPVGDNNTAEGRAENRRVELKVRF